MSAKTPRDRSLKTCACQQFYAVETIDGQERSYGTGCVKVTNNQFAQGHDAKLVSFLVKADVCGDVIWQYGQNGSIRETRIESAEAAAKLISPELAAKAARAVLNALDRAAARREPKPKADPKPPREPKVTIVDSYTPAAEPEVEARKVTGKVGRWQYEGTEGPDGSFFYKTASGTPITAQAGRWTKIEK
jgi:hypothetical protein